MRMTDDEKLCCGCASLEGDTDYDLKLHIGAVFILFGVSISGTLLPLLSARGRFQQTQSAVMEWLMPFGFGVVLATGFIHMMAEGIAMLSHPCLGSVVEEYESIGLAVVLATVILMQLIECESAVFHANGNETARGHGHGHGGGHSFVPVQRSLVVTSAGQSFFAITPYDNDFLYHPHGKPSIVMVSATPNSRNDATKAAKRKLAAMLFEMGVIFHSMVVGVNLGVTSGSGFKTLLAAMSVHQFFEGIALGGSALGAMENMKKVWLMNLGFAITTPLGIVFGILIRSSYSETSTASLWVQGILNCVAGGILLYTGLVELLTYQMTTNSEFLARPGKQRFSLYAAYWMGAGLMALIGKWA